MSLRTSLGLGIGASGTIDVPTENPATKACDKIRS
jgi:hypothetical protein